MDPRIIVIDGKTYHSINEMPGDLRQKHELSVRSARDPNTNIPDAFENPGSFSDMGGAPDSLENIVAGVKISV